MSIKFSYVSIIFLLILSSCNKEKRNSNKLMKGEVWEVKLISVDGEDKQVYGKWSIETDVDIYDTVPRTEWKFSDQDAVFEWQFDDKGKSFHLQYVQLCEESAGDQLDALDYQTYALSGKYEVERHGKNKMEYKSTATLGYTGKTVEISIQRVK
jgi:hypothetical protein